MPDHRDRSTRLFLFGILTILCGGCSLLLALINLLLPFAGSLLEAPSLKISSVLSGFVFYAAVAVLLIWAGLGSVRKRRWVPPLMVTIGWAWLICGLILVPASMLMLDGMLAPYLTPDTESGVVSIVKGITLALGIGPGILLPWLLIHIYQDRDLLLTCKTADPQPGWADRCSSPVLALSLSLGALGILAIPLALTPAVPFFGLLITGWPGVLLTLLLGGGALYLARSVYRLELSGWWCTTLFLLLIGISTVATFVSDTNIVKVLEVLGYDESQASAILPTGRLLTVWCTIPLTLGSLVYMGFLRKQFVNPELHPNNDSEIKA